MAIVLGGTSAVWVFSAGGIHHNSQGPSLVVFFLLLIAFIRTDLDVFRFEFREQAYAMTLGEIPLVVGLAFASPFVLLSARLLANLVSQGVFSHQRSPKLQVNAVKCVAEVVMAVAAYSAALGGARPTSLRGWGAAFAGASASDAVSLIVVLTAISLTATRPTRRAVASLFSVSGLTVAVNTAFGLLITIVIGADLAAAALLGFLGVTLIVAFRAHGSLRARHRKMALLYTFSRALSSPADADDLVRLLLSETANLMGARSSELVLQTGTGLVRIRLDGDGHIERQPCAQADVIEAAVLSDNQVAMLPGSTMAPEMRSWLDARGLQDAVLAPLPGEDGPSGFLAITDRLGDGQTFDRDDGLVLEALANHAAVALRRSELLDQLRREVAAKEHQALHDSLTGLPNRTLFSQRLADALSVRHAGEIVAVILMDLDSFKEVNDTLGHHTGDRVLRELALRLAREVSSPGLAARLGGDEFAVLLPGVASAEAAAEVATALTQAVQRPVTVDELILECRASVGLALAPAHGEDAVSLLQRADVAMYAAKERKAGLATYSPELDHYSPRRLTLAGDLRRAIEERVGLHLAFQPKVELATGDVIGVEALARWTHPRHGAIPPDEFIPVAEQSGLIRPLTTWVLREAVAQLAIWRDEGRQLTMAVNLSARNLLDLSLADEVAEVLRAAGAPSRLLTLELTESTVMADPVLSTRVLHQLGDIGARLSIDDFGTGYSSLSRLTRLPVSEVKIDKSFVFNMANDPGDDAIVRAIIELARSLNLRVVAEGVENTSTWRRLADLGCHAAQGYLISKPLPEPEFERWLSSYEASRSVISALRSGAGDPPARRPAFAPSPAGTAPVLPFPLATE